MDCDLLAPDCSPQPATQVLAGLFHGQSFHNGRIVQSQLRALSPTRLEIPSLNGYSRHEILVARVRKFAVEIDKIHLQLWIARMRPNQEVEVRSFSREKLPVQKSEQSSLTLP
jgi:hypothetical protein